MHSRTARRTAVCWGSRAATLHAHCRTEPVGEGSTRLNFNVNWMGANLPADKKQGMMAGQAANFELFKKVARPIPPSLIGAAELLTLNIRE